MLLIYQDVNYSQPWGSTNFPDMNNIPWSSPTSETDKANGWQTGTLVAYLKNIGNKTIQVDASDSQQPKYLSPGVINPHFTVRPGIGISSNTVTLEPKKYSPIAITINVNPRVLSLSPSNAMIYFHIYPVAESNSNIMIAAIIIAAILMLGTEVWYLRQKRRSMFNLLWNLLNWIGFIIVLSLENKTINPVSDDGAKKAEPLAD
jgi:hypothetical protein